MKAKNNACVNMRWKIKQQKKGKIRKETKSKAFSGESDRPQADVREAEENASIPHPQSSSQPQSTFSPEADSEEFTALHADGWQHGM